MASGLVSVLIQPYIGRDSKTEDHFSRVVDALQIGTD
jgi:hypothetical protein